MTVDLRGEYSIMQFVLQLGSDCEVIEPKELKTKVHQEILRMYEIYEKKD